MLVVEDESIVAFDIQQTLEGYGYGPVEVAASADEALDRAYQLYPDVALMDIRIKGSVDGIATAHLLQDRFDLPVIFLTAHADVATFERAEKTQPQSYLLKPVKPAELRNAIELAISHHKSMKRLREREREVEADLAVANERFRLAIRAGKIVGWDLDVKTGRDHWFGDLQTMFGIPSDTYSGVVSDFYRFVHPDDRQRVAKAVADAREGHKPYAAEFRVIRDDGQVRWVSATGEFHYSENGEPLRMLGVAVDITERAEARRSLAKSEEKFSKAFRGSPVAMTLTSLQTHRYLDVNETFERQTGWKRDEVIGRTPFDIQIWADPSQRVEFSKQMQADGAVRDLEVLYRCKDGTQRVGLGSAELIEVEGEPCAISSIVDITDRKLAEEGLLQKDAELAEAQQVAQLGSWYWDRKTGEITWSKELYELHGLDPKLPAPSVEESEHLFAPESWKRLREVMAEARENGSVRDIDLEIIRPDGSRRWLATRGQPLHDAKGEVIAFRGTAQDITQRKFAEIHLHEYAEAVEGADEMIAVIDRDFRYVIANRALLHQRQMTREQMVGHQISEVVGQPFFESIAKPRLEKCFQGEVVRYETRYAYPDLGERDLFISYYPIAGPEGVERVACILQDITERRRAEDLLKRSEQHNRDLVLRSPVAMVVTHGPEMKVELINFKATALFGYTIEDIPDEAHWWPLAYPDEKYREEVRHEWRMRVNEAVSQKASIEPMEATVRCKDGSSRHIQFHFASFGDAGLVSFVDLTDRQRAEAQLRESEERFRLVSNTAPVMIWMAGTDKLCNYFNRPWIEFTGRTFEQELGNGWADGVHTEDFDSCLKTYVESFDRREPFTMQYRLRRHDGEYRWVMDSGVPRFNPDGSFAGYIGSAIDVTEQKVAQEALATMGRKLIEAHEEERTWIGRELHDDINQQLALLAVELDRWNQQLPLRAEAQEQFRHVQQRISEIARDVQALSHRLHSSKLDYLGLAAAANSFCKELSEQNQTLIRFKHSNVPRTLPKEISLCLFRVLQEALQNAIKHSGAREFEVELVGRPDALELTVTDAGVGFDEQEALNLRGLGLISMRERMQLVGGEFVIQSKPGHGTIIRARVPLKAVEQRAMAG